VLRVATVKNNTTHFNRFWGEMCQKKPLRWIYVTASPFYGSPRVEFHNTPEFTTHQNLAPDLSIAMTAEIHFPQTGEIRKKRGI
jgi:hypothetical protein